MVNQVHRTNDTSNDPQDASRRIIAASRNKALSPNYRIGFLNTLGLRPVIGFWRQLFRIAFILVVSLNFFAILLIANRVYSYGTRSRPKIECYGPFLIMGRAEQKESARELAYQEIPELAADMNLIIGEFDIIEAKVFDSKWSDGKYEANLSLYATNFPTNQPLNVIDGN